ncbi:MAG: hypothetical protein IJP13_05820 [Lachnospiraceae bacterium]|nr:hypothetical protein [Lachnospiraceae bacterium]
MKNSKLFKSLSALALAGVMVISSVSPASADETQVTDKPGFDTSFENEVGVKYLSEEDTIEFIETINGKSVSEMPDLVIQKNATVHIVDENTVFSIDWDKSTYSKEDVKNIYLETWLWYRDEDGALKFVVGYPDDGEEHTEDDYFRVGIDLKLMENAKGEYNIQDNCYYSTDDYLADGGDEELADTSTWEENGGPKECAGGSLWFECNFNSMLLSDIMDMMNSTDTSSWSEPQCIFTGGVDLRNIDSYFDNNMFMARLCIAYTDPETNKDMIAWDYVVSEGALENENNPFTYLDEKPEDDTTVEEDKKDDTTTEVKEVTLTEESKAISKDDMAALITENATKDVVIKTPEGVSLTFTKGTMKAVEGKETYDFGLSMSDDYSKHSDMGVVTKDNFVSVIDFNYSGKLPAEATVKIPVGVERAGQTLYYSQKVEAGYTLVQSVKVDSEGYITVKQDHCSTYVVTTTDVSKETSTSAPEGSTEAPNTPNTPNAGDSINITLWVVLLVVSVAMLVTTVGVKMRKRA